mmetsp:Transcript_29200/g.84551  ORF Transcript_29200/g.84551 Transcript_29200/m.84551 type:complete len:339 (-) Transcript_29200:136-1152(-)
MLSDGLSRLVTGDHGLNSLLHCVAHSHLALGGERHWGPHVRRHRDRLGCGADGHGLLDGRGCHVNGLRSGHKRSHGAGLHRDSGAWCSHVHRLRRGNDRRHRRRADGLHGHISGKSRRLHGHLPNGLGRRHVHGRGGDRRRWHCDLHGSGCGHVHRLGNGGVRLGNRLHRRLLGLRCPSHHVNRRGRDCRRRASHLHGGRCRHGVNLGRRLHGHLLGLGSCGRDVHWRGSDCGRRPGRLHGTMCRHVHDLGIGRGRRQLVLRRGRGGHVHRRGRDDPRRRRERGHWCCLPDSCDHRLHHYRHSDWLSRHRSSRVARAGNRRHWGRHGAAHGRGVELLP